ncbi:MAG: hypothetical protein IKS67_02275, partial [Victivallales bacterium]|nr:hypothetical protein [Victivallales bacterium]
MVLFQKIKSMKTRGTETGGLRPAQGAPTAGAAPGGGRRRQEKRTRGGAPETAPAPPLAGEDRASLGFR